MVSKYPEGEVYMMMIYEWVLGIILLAAGNGKGRLPSGEGDIFAMQRPPSPDEILATDDIARKHPATEAAEFVAIQGTLVKERRQKGNDDGRMGGCAYRYSHEGDQAIPATNTTVEDVVVPCLPMRAIGLERKALVSTAKKKQSLLRLNTYLASEQDILNTTA
jgi:hypothetical protein